MTRPVKLSPKNKDVYQSYIWTTAQGKWSIDEKRIVYRLIDYAQASLKGVKIKENIKPLYVEENIFGDKTFAFYVKDLLAEGMESKHYDRIKKALDSLEEKKVYFEDEKEETWEKHRLIREPKVKKGLATFIVNDWFWKVCLNFSKGYRKFELITAMKLKSPYSMRFYELMSGTNKPLTFSVEELRTMLGLGEKYKRPASILQKIIIPSKNELDECAPWSFNVNVIRKDNEKKTSPIIQFQFFPIFNAENRDKNLLMYENIPQITTQRLIGKPEVYNILRNMCNFSVAELNRHKALWKEACDKVELFPKLLVDIVWSDGYRGADNKKGYIVNATKNLLSKTQFETKLKEVFSDSQEIKETNHEEIRKQVEKELGKEQARKLYNKLGADQANKLWVTYTPAEISDMFLKD